MDVLGALGILVRVVETGSFSAVARERALSQAAVEGIEAALGQQGPLPVGLVRVGVTVAASRLLSLRLPSLLIDHPRLKVELVVGDRLNDLIDNRLDFAMRAGEITDASLVVRRSGTAP